MQVLLFHSIYRITIICFTLIIYKNTILVKKALLLHACIPTYMYYIFMYIILYTTLRYTSFSVARSRSQRMRCPARSRAVTFSSLFPRCMYALICVTEDLNILSIIYNIYITYYYYYYYHSTTRHDTTPSRLACSVVVHVRTGRTSGEMM